MLSEREFRRVVERELQLLVDRGIDVGDIEIRNVGFARVYKEYQIWVGGVRAVSVVMDGDGGVEVTHDGGFSIFD